MAAPTCFTSHAAKRSPATSGCSDEELSSWLRELRLAREEQLLRIGYNDKRYRLPQLQWTQSSFIQPQAMIQDRFLYDPRAGHYTVDRYLADLEKRYGGIDSVLLWPAYPTLGVDDRNQFELLQSLPGGLPALRDMIADFHRHGVRVLLPMMLWDQGTNPSNAITPQTLAKMMKEVNADGVNGDTQSGVPMSFVAAAEDVDHPLAFEPELTAPDEAVAYNLMNWGQYNYPEVPLVDRLKWLESRHMVHLSDRLSKGKQDMLQFAFFNGVGIESWENIWGLWNGLTAWDGEAIRRVATIERGSASLLSSPDWQPYAPMLRDGVFASLWRRDDRALWTIVNRNSYAVSGPMIKVAADKGAKYIDLYHGVEIEPARIGDNAVLEVPIEANGFGAVLQINGDVDPATHALMAKMRTMTASSLSGYSKTWKPLLQTMSPIEATKTLTSPPSDMVRVPGGDFLFKVKAVQIEGSGMDGADVQYPWEDTPRTEHQHIMHLKTFWIDRYPVTNAQFKKFLDVTGYSPNDGTNFLRDWKSGAYPQGWDNKPVTWVSREDAKAYAAWAGKRLPNEWEWQYAAQGSDGRVYPWGNDWNPDAVPSPDKGRTMRGPDDVSAHSKGASPFGVMDLVGNVWQWTNEFSDEHTRAAVLRGGSYYQPQRSMWYFPQAYRLDQHERLLLMAPSMDRSGAIGFRCAAD